MGTVTLPKLSQTGTNEWLDVEDNDVALRDEINGNLDNTNLKAAAAIVGTKLASATVADDRLASPNNSTYKTLLVVNTALRADVVAGTYLCLTGADGVTSGSNLAVTPPRGLYFDDADFTVGSLTQKLRVRAQVAANATAPAITFTVGLYPVTVAGAADTLTYTLGTVVSGSTVAIASPSASTITQGSSGDFTIPADGFYLLGVVTSGTLANNSATSVNAQLQTRNV